jgi:O-acetyl-ADP-ribose deacetylase (regulator of RNase III)
MPEKAWSFGDPGQTLTLVQGDLTRADVDALVNAANARLAGGGGVDGAIHAAAGPKLLEACQAIIRTRGPLDAGEAVLTPGFGLRAPYVIHTVGPIWRGGGADEPARLRAAYENSLRLAQQQGLRSVGFPAISCGVYGYPLEKAAPIALDAMRQALQEARVESIHFYHFSPASYAKWADLAAQILGPCS